MKPYIIAAALFVTGILTLAVLASNLMAPPERPKSQPHAAPQPKTGGGYATEGPATPSYPAGSGTSGTTAGKLGAAGTSGMPSTGMPGMGMSPGSSAAPGMSGPIGASGMPPVSMPKPPEIQPTNPVPIIQPDDLGTQSSPTRGRVHQ